MSDMLNLTPHLEKFTMNTHISIVRFSMELEYSALKKERN